MLDKGVDLPPSQFEAAFLSAAHTEKDIHHTIAAAKQAFAMDCVATGRLSSTNIAELKAEADQLGCSPSFPESSQTRYPSA